MPNLLFRYATPLTTGLFLVSLISGLALFLHVGPSGVHGMHEWLSLLLILPFGLHLWRNWRPMTAYLRHGPMAVSLIASAVAAGLFLLPLGGAGPAGGPPVMRMGQAVLQATPAELADALHTTPGAMVAALQAAGFAAAAEDATLADAATAAGRDGNALVAVLLAPAG